MVMTKTRRAKVRSMRVATAEDPMAFLEAMGIVTRGGFGLAPMLEPYLRDAIGTSHRARLLPTRVMELRERVREYSKPGEDLSDLVIQMREE